MTFRSLPCSPIRTVFPARSADIVDVLEPSTAAPTSGPLGFDSLCSSIVAMPSYPPKPLRLLSVTCREM